MALRIFTLVFLFSLLATQVVAEVPACAKIFGPTLVQGDVYVEKGEEHIFYMEQDNPSRDRPFHFKGVYDQANKSISLYINLVDRDNHVRSQIPGKKAYDEMMIHFADKDIRFIRGHWKSSDNASAYLYNKDELGMTPEEAALNTWSGQQAKKYGFENVRIVFDDTVREGRGGRHLIEVEFHKDEIPTGWRRLRDFFRR